MLQLLESREAKWNPENQSLVALADPGAFSLSPLPSPLLIASICPHLQHPFLQPFLTKPDKARGMKQASQSQGTACEDPPALPEGSVLFCSLQGPRL